MITIEEMQEMLERAAEKIPQELYAELNGGIILLPDTKLHEQAISKDLYILGEYHRSRALGRYIAIYYGSFKKVSANLSNEELEKRLEHTLKHEFTHHIESLAGERDLEIEDDVNLSNYLRRHNYHQ